MLQEMTPKEPLSTKTRRNPKGSGQLCLQPTALRPTTQLQAQRTGASHSSRSMRLRRQKGCAQAHLILSYSWDVVVTRSSPT